MQPFASQLKRNTFHSIVTYELFFPPFFICLFVWQQSIKSNVKISRNRAVTVRDRNLQKKCSLETKRKETENIVTKWLTKKERIEISIEIKFWRNLHHRLKKYFKKQQCTFLERNEYSPYNINRRNVLASAFFPII